VESPGTAPGSEPSITRAFITIATLRQPAKYMGPVLKLEESSENIQLDLYHAANLTGLTLY